MSNERAVEILLKIQSGVLFGRPHIHEEEVALDMGASALRELSALKERLALLERLYDIVSKADHFDTGLQVGDDFDKVIEELEKP